MPLTEVEKMLIEEISTMLSKGDKLGLKNKDDSFEQKGISQSSQFAREDIDASFRTKVNSSNLNHYDAITASFAKIHSYKNIDDDSFQEAFEHDMTAQGLPREEITKAVELVNKIIEEYLEEGQWDEKDYGLNPHMDEIIDVSKPENEDNKSEIIDSDLNHQNVKKMKHGDASPLRAYET